MDSESNVLQDGSLVDLCGATLLWRTAEGLFHAPTQKHLEALRQELNAARPQCPVGLNTLAFPSMQRSSRALPSIAQQQDKQPWVYLACGHVHGYHEWGHSSEREPNGKRECPMCRAVGPYVPLWLGCEPAFYVDSGAPSHAFVPCGHVCSEKSVRYWSEIPLPHGTHAFHAACPFCATQLSVTQGCAKLIFQGPVDWVQDRMQQTRKDWWDSDVDKNCKRKKREHSKGLHTASHEAMLTYSNTTSSG